MGVRGESSSTGVGVVGVSTSGIGITATGGLAPIQLQPAAGSGEPSTGTHARGELFVDNSGDLFLCTASGSPGTWTVLNNQATGGTVSEFVPLASPIRIYYSLNAGDPPLANTQERSVTVTNGGTIPHAATAVLTNLAVTETAAGGFLAMFKHGTTWPGTSNLNYPPGGFASNNATSAVALDAGVGKVRIRCGGATAHFVVDVFGYYT